MFLPHLGGREASQSQKGGAPSEAVSGMSDSQLRAVKEAVREMLGARNWTGSATVASLQARISLSGHDLTEELLIKVRIHVVFRLALLILIGTHVSKLRNSCL